jgi:hypothetical protein
VKRAVKCTTYMALAAVVFLTWVCRPAGGQADGPTMVVTAGFDGYCRHGDGGDWCAVYAVLSNEGRDVEGELRVVAAAAAGAPTVYARRVVLPARSRKAYFLYYPSAEYGSRSRLAVQLVAGDTVLSSEQAAVTWLDEGDRLYGVASSNPSALNFLSDVAPPGGRAAVAHLSLETLPPDPLGWQGLDVLVLNDVDTAGLSGEQRRALETWVAHGGHLVVGGGAGAARTVAKVADLLPVAVGSTRLADDLRALGERMGASIAAGPYAVAEAGLRDGEVLVEQGGLILWARRTLGMGRVDFVAFDAGLNPFVRWNDNIRLWKWFVGTEAAGARRFAVRNGYRAREAINAVPGLELPSMLHILAFMLVYTLLVGPVNYLVLRKLDRRELAWLTVPALALGFTAMAYVAGFQIRGGTAIVHRLAVVYVPQGSSVGSASEVVGLFSPRRTSYDVWVETAGVREISDAALGRSARQPLHVVAEASGATVTGLRVDVGGIQSFVAEGYVDVPAVDADLRMVGSGSGDLRVKGTLRNGGVVLKGAVVVVGDEEQMLGDLEAGEGASIDLAHDGGGQPDTAEQVLGPGDYWKDRELYRRYQFLEALSLGDRPAARLGSESGVYLVGWADGAPAAVEVVGRPFSTVGTTLYVYALPVAGLAEGTQVTIPPGLIARQVEEITGGVEVRPEGFHMGPGSEVAFRFTMWRGVAVHHVDELVLGLEGISYGTTSRPPVVSMWNEGRGDWERLDVGWGSRSIADAAAYVGRSGDVLLRLETGAEWSADVQSLTITIRGQR